MKILMLDSGRGLIPFINEIIIQNKKNEYYFFMDYQYFPYGNKSEFQLKKRLKKLLKKFEKNNFDLILICCNTLSAIYLKYKIKCRIPIKTIFELNKKHIANKKILVTPNLKKLFKDDQRFIATNLATFIEHNDLEGIITTIKGLKKQKYVLGCTHYPLVKRYFEFYLNENVYSYEDEMIRNLPNTKEMKFYARDYEYKIIVQYFPNMVINHFNIS